jgi:hypothetical protein
MSAVERLAEKLTGFGAAIAPPQHGAEVGKGARPLQLRVAACEVVDSLAKQSLSPVATRYQAGGSLCDAQRTRGAERLGELELLCCEPLSRVTIATRQLDERGLGSPG